MKKLVSTFLNGVTVVDAPRSEVALLLFSNLFALNLALPTSKVDNVSEYYVTTHLHSVEVLVSELNEDITINVPMLMEMIRKSWLRRYEAVYVPFGELALYLHAELFVNSNSSLSDKMKQTACALSLDNYYRGFLLSCQEALIADGAAGAAVPS